MICPDVWTLVALLVEGPTPGPSKLSLESDQLHVVTALPPLHVAVRSTVPLTAIVDGEKVMSQPDGAVDVVQLTDLVELRLGPWALVATMPYVTEPATPDVAEHVDAVLVAQFPPVHWYPVGLWVQFAVSRTVLPGRPLAAPLIEHDGTLGVPEDTQVSVWTGGVPLGALSCHVPSQSPMAREVLAAEAGDAPSRANGSVAAAAAAKRRRFSVDVMAMRPYANSGPVRGAAGAMAVGLEISNDAALYTNWDGGARNMIPSYHHTRFDGERKVLKAPLPSSVVSAAHPGPARTGPHGSERPSATAARSPSDV